MFEVVVTGSRTRRTLDRPDVVLGSVALHALMLAGLVTLSIRTPPPAIDLNQEMASFIEVLARVPTLPSLPSGAGPGSGTATAAPSQAAAPAPSSVALSKISLELPDVGAALPSVSELGGVEAGAFGAFEGTRGMGPVGGQPTEDELLAENSAGTPVVSEAMLAEKPRIINRFEMEEQWQRLYPAVLNAKGVSGETVVSFVIDTQGRVEPQTIRMVFASHPEFIVATITGVKRMRFAPARLNGSPVRVRAVMPVHWRPLEG